MYHLLLSVIHALATLVHGIAVRHATFTFFVRCMAQWAGPHGTLHLSVTVTPGPDSSFPGCRAEYLFSPLLHASRCNGFFVCHCTGMCTGATHLTLLVQCTGFFSCASADGSLRRLLLFRIHCWTQLETSFVILRSNPFVRHCVSIPL